MHSKTKAPACPSVQDVVSRTTSCAGYGADQLHRPTVTLSSEADLSSGGGLLLFRGGGSDRLLPCSSRLALLAKLSFPLVCLLGLALNENRMRPAFQGTVPGLSRPP